MEKILYIASLDVGYTRLLRVFYAADENEAQQKKAGLELEHNARCDDLKSYPTGFRLVMSTIPGTIEVSDEQVKSEYCEKAGF